MLSLVAGVWKAGKKGTRQDYQISAWVALSGWSLEAESRGSPSWLSPSVLELSPVPERGRENRSVDKLQNIYSQLCTEVEP